MHNRSVNTLDPARGISWGIALSIPAWGVTIGLIWLGLRVAAF